MADADGADAKVDWSKSDFYLEAEALAACPPGQRPGERALEGWWIVHAERVAVRDRPDRAEGKALDVFRKGTALRVESTETGGDGNLWVQLAASELEHLARTGGRAKPEAAYALVHDPSSLPGPLVQPVPPEGARFFDGLEAVHPRERGAAVAPKLQAELEASRKEREAAAEAAMVTGEAELLGEAAVSRDQNVATYERPAGPARPPRFAPSAEGAGDEVVTSAQSMGSDEVE